MQKRWIGLVSLIFTLLLTCSPINYACTDFRLTAQDGSVLITRSMEFAFDMHSNVRTSPRGRPFNLLSPDGKQSFAWKAKYGYLYVDGLGLDVTIDGMNEAGLSYEALLFPGYAKYQSVGSKPSTKILPYINLGDWILSNFQNIEEVRKVLPTITVVSKILPGMGDTIFPLHAAVYDTSGKGLIIEFVDGKLTMYDSMGVMTNSPDYAWHEKNLINYLHLAPVNPPSVVIDGLTFAATGQGYGMVGLPGDISPPSRFIKTTALVRTALPVANGLEALNVAEHIINNVDIPRGLVREPNNGNQPTNETTQWVVFKDLTHKRFYYRTYGDLTLRLIDMQSLDFSENAPLLKMPIDRQNTIQNLTESFKQLVTKH